MLIKFDLYHVTAHCDTPDVSWKNSFETKGHSGLKGPQGSLDSVNNKVNNPSTIETFRILTENFFSHIRLRSIAIGVLEKPTPDVKSISFDVNKLVELFNSKISFTPKACFSNIN